MKEVYALTIKMGGRASKLALKGNGHNEFLKHITVSLLIVAPNSFWKQADQYKVGFIDLSTSVMHNALDRDLNQTDFEYHIPETYIELLSHFRLQVLDGKMLFDEYVNMIPEGFLYTRVVTTNYMALRNIINQRKNHKLLNWKYFCNRVLEIVDFPEWLQKCPDLPNGGKTG